MIQEIIRAPIGTGVCSSTLMRTKITDALQSGRTVTVISPQMDLSEQWRRLYPDTQLDSVTASQWLRRAKDAPDSLIIADESEHPSMKMIHQRLISIPNHVCVLLRK